MKTSPKVMTLLVAICFFLFVGAAEEAHALLAAHQNACFFCHDYHGAPAGSLRNQVNTELLCLACHSVSINDTAAAVVHNPGNYNSNQVGYITCRECHTTHDNISGNIKMVGYDYDPEYDQSPSVASIRVEHPDWTGPLTYRQVTYYNSTDFNHDGTFPGPGPCQICHDPNHNPGQDCTDCHGHDVGFPAPDCTANGCHDGTKETYDAELVSVHSSHSTNTIYNSITVTFTCGDCHGSHGSGTVEVPNNTAVGINYSANGESGIALGSAIATGSSEAQICWNCHDTYGVSEWGLNTDTNGTESNYNTGTLSQSNWVGATWSSAQSLFSYKSGTIQSTHSVNNSVTLPGVDSVGNIRCSYCHDVHELNLATGDSTSGKPYLRGNWMGNPYREDGAPQAGTTYASQGDFGVVPRGGTGATELGGYQIDQNNGDPTSGWTLTGSAGLCMLCHTEDVNGTSVSVNTMNYYGTASTDWVGTNGHANAVIGGTGSGSNIFNETDRKPTDGYCPPNSGTDSDGIGNSDNSYCAGEPNMAYQQHSDESNLEAYGVRGTSGQGSGFFMKPPVNAARPYAYNDYNWGATVDTGTTDNDYHQFSCSKCHNPHASRLPRLMITNCLDTKHNTWDNNPKSIVDGDTVTITNSSCYNNQTFTVRGLEVKNDAIMLDSSSFGSDCGIGNSSLTLTWNSTDYSLNRVDFKDSGAQVTINSTTYTYDTIELNTRTDLNKFIGRQVSSFSSPNGEEKSHIHNDNSGVPLSNSTSAQNCHRVADPDYSNAGGSGWNNVTPWTP